MRIIVADDTPKVRFALRVLIERQPKLRVIGEAVDAGELLAMSQAVCPDLILLDWELPGLDPDETLETLRCFCPGIQIIALSSHIESQPAALSAGVDAFISKTIPPDHLLTAIMDSQITHASEGRFIF